MAHLLVSAHLYCHLAAKGVPTGDGVPAEEMGGEVGLKLLSHKNVMFSDSLSLSHTQARIHMHTSVPFIHSLHLLKKSGANRKQAYADREEFTDRRASYEKDREIEKKPNKSALFLVCTNRKQWDICMAGGSAGVSVSEQLTASSWGSTYSSSPILDREWMALASTGRYTHTNIHNTITTDS